LYGNHLCLLIFACFCRCPEKRRMWRNLEFAKRNDMGSAKVCLFFILWSYVSLPVCLSLLASSYIAHNRFKLPCVRTMQFNMYCLLNSIHKKGQVCGLFCF
jgi:hypothetical protein